MNSNTIKYFRRKGLLPVEYWVEGYSMKNVYVSPDDRLNGSPKVGDVIAFDGEDMALIPKDYFEAHYERVEVDNDN